MCPLICIHYVPINYLFVVCYLCLRAKGGLLDVSKSGHPILSSDKWHRVPRLAAIFSFSLCTCFIILLLYVHNVLYYKHLSFFYHLSTHMYFIICTIILFDYPYIYCFIICASLFYALHISLFYYLYILFHFISRTII